MRSTWMMAGLTVMLAAGLVGCGDDEAEVPGGWPRPSAGQTAVYRADIVMQGSVVRGSEPLAVTCRVKTEHAVEVLDVQADGLDVQITQGRTWGDVETSDVHEVRHFPYALLARLARGAGLAFSEPGRTVVLRGSPGGDVPAADEGPQPIVWAVAPSPTTEAVLAEGTKWEYAATLPLANGAERGSVRATVSAVDAESVTVRLEFSTDAKPVGTQVLRYSRSDGLLLDGTTAITRRFTVKGVALSQEVTGTIERVEAADEPDDAPIQSALDGLSAASPEVRAKAASDLANSWPRSGRAVPVLAAALRDDDAGVRGAAGAALEDLGPKGVLPIVAFLLDEDDLERAGYIQSVETIHQLGAKVTPSDIAAAMTQGRRLGAVAYALVAPRGTSESDRVPHEVYLILADEARRRVAAGMELRDRRDVEVASAALALAGLSELPRSSSRPAPLGVAPLLASENPTTRWSGVRILDRFGSAHPRALEMLEGLRDDKDKIVQVSVANALRRLRDEETRSIEELAAMLESSGGWKRRWAMTELSKRGADGAVAVPVLVELLRSERRDSDWAQSIQALGRIGPAAKAALPDLERLLQGARPDLERGIVEPWAIDAAAAACRIDAPTRQWVAFLIAGLEAWTSPGEGDRDRARRSLLGLDGLFEEMDPKVRKDAVAALVGVVASAPDPWVQVPAVRLVGLRGPEAGDAVPHLISALEQGDAHWQGMLAGDGAGSEVPSWPGDLPDLLVRVGGNLSMALAFRYELVDVLGRMGSKAKSAEALLERLAAEGTDDVMRYRAARALRRIRA